MTDLQTTLDQLHAAAKPSTAAIYRRHGAGDETIGVPFADLRRIAKSIGKDTALARELWATGMPDARLLACSVADPADLDEAALDAWLGEIEYYVLVDEFVANLAARKPGLTARADRWIASDRDWTAQAGWDVLAVEAMRELDAGDGRFRAALEQIERDIGPAGNRSRHAMNGALIAIGLRSPELEAEAKAVARRIGPVVVDHGQTGCVTPEAIAYIDRTVARREAQAEKRRAKAAAGA